MKVLRFSENDIKVYRDEIYLGEVIKDIPTVTHKDEESRIYLPRKLDGQLSPNIYIPYRNILFAPNEEELAFDLGYNSPNYPILNMTDDEICLNLQEESILIHNIYNLGMLLQRMNFEDILNFQDIQKVYPILANHIIDIKMFLCDGIVTPELQKVFEMLKTKSFYEESTNSSLFTPAIEEGPIRKLERWY